MRYNIYAATLVLLTTIIVRAENLPLFDHPEPTIAQLQAQIASLESQIGSSQYMNLCIEDFWAIGYPENMIVESPNFSDQAFATAIEIIRTGDRGGVIWLPNKTFYLAEPIEIARCPGLEIRGYGGHYQTNRTTDRPFGMATIRCQPGQHAIHYEYNSDPKPALILRNIALSGSHIPVPSGPAPDRMGNSAGIYIDISNGASSQVTVINCYIANFDYGLRSSL